MNTSTQRTALYDVHVELGAKIIPFGGFDMPVNYPKGILQEHFAVRRRVGIFDVSHMGEVEIHGANALDFVQTLTTNDASKLVRGKAQYSAMCYDDGGIVDDLLVYHCGDYFMLVINASNIAKDLAWMRSVAERLAEKGLNDVEIRDCSAEMQLLAVQGPKSIETLQKLTATPLHEIEYYNFAFGTLAGEEMILSRTGYTGEIGFELYFRADAAKARAVWTAIMQAGAEFAIEPCGLGARDTLRLEKGFALYGNDIDQTTLPLEAGLGWITKLAKSDFTGKHALESAKEQGLKRKLVAFKLQQEKIIPRQAYTLHADGKHIGTVTSGGISPMLNMGIGMGYVDAAYSQVGAVIAVAVRGKEYPADVVKLPFV
ncbi:MAG: glycine cleavage system aminomethyltransferase GcvT [Candidatus Kapaibacterium sp.]|nr:MAG: glycine cleavage system aminomethyltransferase GcvT [Candidatus Kapabacteria bacterium]